MLFVSDDGLRRLQRDAARPPKGTTVPADELRREAIDDARELRAHRRAREFGVLLFIAPALIAILTAIIGSIVVHALRGGGSS